MRALKAIIKLLAFFILVIWVIPTQGIVLLFTKGRGSYYLPCLWHRAVCQVFGIRFEIAGQPSTKHQTLYMSNHLSYLDIPMIGSVLKHSFIAKSEVEGWALFGFLSKLQQTAFIQRKSSAARKVKNELQSRITAGESLIVFPEGTSTDGQNVLPFKSSLFSLAFAEEAKDIYVQPITLQLLEVDGKTPKTQKIRDLYAWHIAMDTELAVHLWGFAKTSGAKLRLIFHKPLRASDYQNRKVLAKTCHDNVSKGLKSALAA